LQLHDIRITGQ